MATDILKTQYNKRKIFNGFGVTRKVLYRYKYIIYTYKYDNFK